nr:MlaD family protein [Paraburkholderia phenoliruptrix]
MDLSDPASMRAMLSGPEIVMDPGSGEPASHFDGLDRRPALAPGHGPIVTYLVRFDGAVGELKNGAKVQLRGFDVGTVTSVRLNYDARTGALSTPVQIALNPSQLGIGGAPPRLTATGARSSTACSAASSPRGYARACRRIRPSSARTRSIWISCKARRRRRWQARTASP